MKQDTPEQEQAEDYVHDVRTARVVEERLGTDALDVLSDECETLYADLS